MTQLNEILEGKLVNLAKTLVNQERARIIVPAQQESTGFWFGGGNMIEDDDGRFHVVGRYRNYGDSRTGVGAGDRGLELAIFRSNDRGQTFEKTLSLSKTDLNIDDRPVLSIEGSALRWTDDGVELFVSTEKDNIGYPPHLAGHLKPGTGVWTIERLCAHSIEGLMGAKIETVLETKDPRVLHIKDPFVYGNKLLFCTHPFSWSSSNTGYAVCNPNGEVDAPVFDFFPRGMTWDVAMTRGTAVIDVPRVGAFSELNASLVFYDGGESLRNMDEHATAVKRPRGYSCEELGGVAYIADGDLNNIHRLSRELPMFISPHGTGCSRYVDVMAGHDGLYATWQQSQADLSQPLVLNHVSSERVAALLS